MATEVSVHGVTKTNQMSIEVKPSVRTQQALLMRVIHRDRQNGSVVAARSVASYSQSEFENCHGILCKTGSCLSK